MGGLDLEMTCEEIKAEDDLCQRTIPYQDRVLVKLDQAELGVSAGGIHEVETRQKYAKEAIAGTCVRSGKRVRLVGHGDRVWLDRKTWVPKARYVIVREKDVLAYEPAATGEWDATATTGFGSTG